VLRRALEVWTVVGWSEKVNCVQRMPSTIGNAYFSETCPSWRSTKPKMHPSQSNQSHPPLASANPAPSLSQISSTNLSHLQQKQTLHIHRDISTYHKPLLQIAPMWGRPCPTSSLFASPAGHLRSPTTAGWGPSSSTSRTKRRSFLETEPNFRMDTLQYSHNVPTLRVFVARR
jgi:hypothetical protein